MHTVLLVEDDAIVARLTTVLLTRNGWAVHHVASGRAAIATLSEHRYSLIVLDLGLPDIDGTGVLLWLRAFEARMQRSRTPVVVASASGSRGTGIDPNDVDGVLQKPIAMSGLNALLDAKEPSRDDGTN